MPVGLAVGDISTFRKYVKNIGRAYQKRSVAMIQLCRLFVEISSGKLDQSEALRSLFEIVEYALRSAVEAGKGRSDVADEAFATAEEELDQYALRYHSSEQAVLGDVHDIIEDAAQKDTQIMKTYNRLSSRLGLNRTDTPRSLTKVRFQVLHSPTDRHLAPIVTCELGPEVNVSELLWTFSRLPEDQRVTLKQNPHFYLSKDLSDRPLAYDEDFVLQPLKDLKPEKDLVVLILSDRTGQIYFDYEKFSKTYGNIWKPHNTIILKDLQGTLEASNRISPKIHGDVCIWQRGGDRPDDDLTEWTTVLDQALGAPDTDWLIRSETSLDEAFDIEVTGGWERCSPIPIPEPAPIFGHGNSITSVPSHEDIAALPEDTPSLDSGYDSFDPTLDASGQPLYYLDDTCPSDDAISSSADEAQIIVERFPPAEDDVSSFTVPSPLDSDVQVETAVPSPVSTPHALPELLDPHFGSELDAASNVFALDRIITPKKTQLLTDYVPPEPTPLPEPPMLPISNDEAVASDDDPTLESTTPLLQSVHPHPQLPLPHPPTLISLPTPPTHASSAPTLNIVAPLEQARHPAEAVHHPAQPVLSPPSPVTPAIESKPAPKSDVAASHERTPTPNPAPRQVEDVRPPVQPLRAHPEPQVSASRVIEPAPACSAPKNDVVASHKPTLASKPAPEPVEVVHLPVQLTLAHVEPQVTASPAIKPAPASSATGPSALVPARRKLSLASKPEPQHVEVVRPPVQPVQAQPVPQVSAPPMVKPAPSSSPTVPSATVTTSRKLSLVSKPEPQHVEAVRPPVQLVQAHPVSQVSASPTTQPTPASIATAPSPPLPAPRKLSLASKPEPQHVEAVRPPVQPVQAQARPEVSASPVVKPALATGATASSAPVPAPRKLSLSSKPETQQVHVVRPPVPPVQAHPESQVATSPVITPAPASIATVPSAPVAAPRKLSLSSKPEPQQVHVVQPPVQPVQAHPEPQVTTSSVTKPAPTSSATAPSVPVARSRKLSVVSKPEPQQVHVVQPPVQPVQAHPEPQVATSSVTKPAPASSATAPSVPVARSRKLSVVSKPPESQQVQAVQPPVQPVQPQAGPEVSASPIVKLTLASDAAVPSTPKSDVPAPRKASISSRSTPEQVEVARPPIQPAPAHPVPQVSAPPVIKPAPSRSAAVPSVPEHDRPRVEPVHSLNLPAHIPEASTSHSNPASASKAPAPDKLSAVLESPRPRVEMVHRLVQQVSTPQSLTSSMAGSRPAAAGSAFTPSKTVPAPERTRSLAAEAVRIPVQHARPAPKSLAPIGNVSGAGYTSGSRSQVAPVPRQLQAVRPTPGSSTLPVRHGPVPASSVPSPNVTRLLPEHARSQVRAGRTSTLAPPPPSSRVPSGSAPGPDMKEVSRRVKSHPRKMVTPVGQRRSVIAPALMVTEPTPPVPELPKSLQVQQPTTRLAPQNGSSLPLQGMSTRMSSVYSPPEPQDKPKVHTTPTAAPTVPTAPSAAPLTRVVDTTGVPAATALERGPRMSNTDGATGRSRRPTVIQEQVTPRHAVRSSILSPIHPEEPARGPPPSRSSTPIARQDRASTVLHDSTPQRRADPVSKPGGWDSTEATTATTPTPAPRATNAAALPTPASSVPPTPPTKPLVHQVTARLSAQPVTHPNQQQTEPVTSTLPNSDRVATTRRSEATRSSYYGSRTETSGMLSRVERSQGEPKLYSTAPPVPSRQQVGSLDVVSGPALRSSTQRITSRIRTKDLINRHKPLPPTDGRSPSSATQSVGSPTVSRSPMSDRSPVTPARLDSNRVDSGIEIWDENALARRRASRILANGDKKDGVHPTKPPTTLESKSSRVLLSHRESRMSIADGATKPPTALESKSSRAHLSHRESRMSISKSHRHPPSPHSSAPEPPTPSTTDSSRGGGAFLTRKPQGPFQTGYSETSTPPRSSTPSSMTHASTAATSTQVTLVTPASSFPNLSSLDSKAQPKSWFRRNVLDPFKSKLGM